MLTLGLLYQNGMMLQRNKPIIIVGNATDGDRITGTLEQDTATTTATDGRFRLEFPPRESGRNLELTIRNHQEEITISDITMGDIYIAGGQSNMEFFLKYEAHWEDTMTDAKSNPSSRSIHLFNVPQICFEGHTRHNPAYGHWFTPDVTEDLACFSAPGYYFAKEIQRHQEVPVGIIGCNWGGTTATSWIPAELLEEGPLSTYLKEYDEACALYSEEEMRRISLDAWAWEDSRENAETFEPLLYGRDRAWQLDYIKRTANNPVIPMGPYNINRPGGLYETMLLRIAGFPCTGVLWYQGESDCGLAHAKLYQELMTRLIHHWRSLWDEDLSFLLVQLAPFGVWLECTNEDYATVRACQQALADTLPRVGMTSICDLGSYYDIHPKEKKEVGRRLSLLARKMIYGEEELVDEPQVIGIERIDDSRLSIHCTNGKVLSCDGFVNDIRVQLNGQQVVVASLELKQMNIILTVPSLALAKPGTVVTIDIATADYNELHIHNEAGLCLHPTTVTLTL
ncbi:MAG: sialate O-acetylesterase [Lachnospiraceae bacterium]|nr:sialate O-acetylesterase [Lachnospiraceae bacterium]